MDKETKFLVQTPRGTFDILPEDQGYYNFINTIAANLAELHGFQKITTPIFEYSKIFTHSIGEDTEIIEKEIYFVHGKQTDDPQELALRPENTAGIVRAYVEHGLFTRPAPQKYYYYGAQFRHDRPQHSRFRQFHQFGIEALGSYDPYVDASIILLAWQIFTKLGLNKKIVLEINSIGCDNCRPRYLKKLKSYLEQYKNIFDFEHLEKIENNPLRILDLKDEKYQKIIQGAPVHLDYLCEECQKHLQTTLEYLDELDIPFDLNPHLVRGLDYYTKTVFEFRDTDDPMKLTTLLGGGRYDKLVSLLGGPETGAVGFSVGLERIINKIKELKTQLPSKKTSKVFVVQLGEKARKRALRLVADLVSWGYCTSYNLDKTSLKSQLRQADKQEVRFALILGQREILDKSVILRDMKSGGQETLDLTNLAQELRARFKN